MTSLPIANPDPANRETVYSYLSRVAATWRTGVVDLANDIGAPFKGFIDQDPNAFEALAAWAGLDMRQMDEMLSWTGVRAGNVRMNFRGELVMSRALRNPVMRGCPVCLREDTVQYDGPSTAAMVMRGDWQFREVNVCVKHSHPLVSLWKNESPRERNDISARLGEVEEDILAGRLDQQQVLPSDYDVWLDRRLRDGSDRTLLVRHPLYPATTFIRLLGQSVAAKIGPEASRSRRDFHAVGFEIARQGESAIRTSLNQIAQEATGPFDEPSKTFGQMYTALNTDTLEDGGFDMYRGILRECILDNWPIAPNEVLLGKTVSERRLHSVRSAAKEIGITSRLLEIHLVDAGVIAELDRRPPSRKLFDAKSSAELLAEVPMLVGPRAMCEKMGATESEFEGLIKEGIIKPRTRSAKVKNPWRFTDGVGLVDELRAKASDLSAPSDERETLIFSRQRTGISLLSLIEAIRADQIGLSQEVGNTGFHGFVVLKAEVDDLAGKVKKEICGPSLPREMSAAEFGRLIGLRNNGNFASLVEAGFTPAEKHINPKTMRSQYIVTAENIEAFHRRFVTLSTLSLETGYHSNTLKRLLSAAGIMRFSPEGQDFGLLYLRSDAAKAFA